jgi:hypothetical protein
MLKLMHPSGAVEWRYVALDFMRIGVSRYIDVDVVATVAHATGLLACTAADRVEVSDDGGSSYTPLGVDVTNGFALGTFTPGQRKALKLKVTIPVGPSREEQIGLELGEGV